MRINYSTAKSIIFQYRNKKIRNNALLDNLNDKNQTTNKSSLKTASYKPLIFEGIPNQSV